MIQVRWTGAAGLEFSYDNATLLIDPCFSRPGMGEVFFRRLTPDREAVEKRLRAMKSVQAVVVSHTHFDHVLDVPVVAARCAGPVLGSRSLANLMGAHGLESRVRVCAPGEMIRIDHRLEITMLPSVHGRMMLGRIPYPGRIDSQPRLPMRAGDFKVGQVYAPKIQLDGQGFLHVGSAGFLDETLKGQTCDVLFLCVPGWDRTPGYPERIIAATRPSTVVLFHHDNFFKPMGPHGRVESFRFIKMQALVERIRKTNPEVRLLCPDMFETMTF